VHSHSLGVMVGLDTQLVQDMCGSNVWNYAQMSKSIHSLIYLGGTTLRHSQDIHKRRLGDNKYSRLL
jgi:hypothetical protein